MGEIQGATEKQNMMKTITSPFAIPGVKPAG